MSQFDPVGTEVAKKVALQEDMASRGEGGQPKPAGLIKTRGASGIEAAEGGGWKTKVDHAPGESADYWKARILGWKNQVPVWHVDDIQWKSKAIQFGNDDIQIHQAILELQKLISEGATITRLEESAVLIEARVQEVSARDADGPPFAMITKESHGKKKTVLCDKGNPGKNSKCPPHKRPKV